MRKLGIIIFLMSFLGTAFPLSASDIYDGGIIEIWGNVSDSKKCAKNKKTAYGTYRIKIENGKASFMPLVTGDRHMANNGGGVIYNGSCTYINIKGSSAEMKSFNTTSWKANGISGEDVSEDNLITSATAYDALTGKIYGCITDRKGREHSYGLVDYKNFRCTALGYNNNHYIAMAVSGTGILYAIDTDGHLHKIDKRSGDTEIIGNTGIIPRDVTQAMAFNENDRMMYWAAAPQGGRSFLCTIDLSNGSIKKVCDFEDNDVISCMYIPDRPADKAPERLYDMDVEFEGALNKGYVTFTLPRNTYDGSEISTPIQYDIMIDDFNVGTFNGEPGRKIRAEVMCEEAGIHVFSVVLRVGDSVNNYNKIAKWIGYDEPSPIRGLKCYTDVDKKVYLRWKPSTGGRHGGYINKKNLVYKIVRNPGGLIVAEECKDTNFTDDISSGNNNSFYYEITPYIKDK